MPAILIVISEDQFLEAVKSTEQIEQDVEQAYELEDEITRQKEQLVSSEADNNTDSIVYLSPQVSGFNGVENASQTGFVEICFTDSLPNGQDRIQIPYPTSKELEDDTHAFNVLLDLFDLSHTEITELVGKKLPIKPYGNYDDPDDVRYKLDIPASCRKRDKFINDVLRLADKHNMVRAYAAPRVKRRIGGVRYEFTDTARFEAVPEASRTFVLRSPYRLTRERTFVYAPTSSFGQLLTLLTVGPSLLVIVLPLLTNYLSLSTVPYSVLLITASVAELVSTYIFQSGLAAIAKRAGAKINSVLPSIR